MNFNGIWECDATSPGLFFHIPDRWRRRQILCLELALIAGILRRGLGIAGRPSHPGSNSIRAVDHKVSWSHSRYRILSVWGFRYPLPRVMLGAMIR